MPRILVVEDSLDHRKLICDILRDEGYRVTEASNGKIAIELLQSGGKIDLITLDEDMPVMTGLACLNAIRSIQNEGIRRIPILFLTHYRKPEIMERNDINILLKPFDYQLLLEAVSRILRENPFVGRSHVKKPRKLTSKLGKKPTVASSEKKKNLCPIP